MFCLERFPFPLGAWDGLRYFIVALPEPSILLFYQFQLIFLNTKCIFVSLEMGKKRKENCNFSYVFFFG